MTTHPAPGLLHPALQHAAAVLVDMDGTLVDSESVGPAVFCQLWREHRRSPAPVDAFTATWRRLAGAPSFPDFLRARLGEDADRFGEQLLARYRQQVSSAPALPGADELLRRLARNGTPRALVTSSTSDQAAAVLAHQGWSFDVVISSDDVTETKPSPEGYLAAAAALDVEGLVVVLEDAPSGLVAARRAGALAIGVAAGSFAPEELDREADMVVASLERLLTPGDARA